MVLRLSASSASGGAASGVWRAMSRTRVGGAPPSSPRACGDGATCVALSAVSVRRRTTLAGNVRRGVREQDQRVGIMREQKPPDAGFGVDHQAEHRRDFSFHFERVRHPLLSRSRTASAPQKENRRHDQGHHRNGDDEHALHAQRQVVPAALQRMAARRRSLKGLRWPQPPAVAPWDAPRRSRPSSSVVDRHADSAAPPPASCRGNWPSRPS